MAREEDEDPDFPFPLSDVSNGEWCPRPPSARQRAAAELLGAEAERRARRLGMSRREFLRSAAGTATAFWVLNTVHGLPSSGGAAVLPVDPAQCDDPETAGELFAADYFVMDVQLHHVDLEAYGDVPALGCLRFYPPGDQCTPGGLELLSQANLVKEVFVDSETAVGVISGVPDGYPMPVDTMAATRDLVNQLAGTERALSQAMCDPKAAPGTQTALDGLERQVTELGGRALKCYTGNGNWFLDDETVAYPMLAEAQRLGLDVINVHKGLPALLGSGAEDFVRSRDLPKALRDWNELRFVAYHSGYFPGEGIGEFLGVVKSIPRKHRKRLYAELGSCFATAFLESPESAAHLVGALLKALGPKQIVWGTDSIWWGSPQWQIDAFKALVIPEKMQRRYGYPPLTKKAKARILGLNAAKLYGVDPKAARCTIAGDALAKLQAEQGGIRASRTHRVYGPRTRASYEALLAHAAGRARTTA
ncbi:MAG TPA: amidohydrolase family protein [Myxococcota bacterium]|nr:amidohydrolase family protein [Myxococcota bacterium]